MDGGEDEATGRGYGRPNHRTFFRVPIEWRGSYDLRASRAEAQVFWALDLSPTGAAVELHGELPGIGDDLTLHFEDSVHFGAADLALRCRVVHQRRRPHHRVFGVTFEGVSNALREELSRIVFVAQRDVLRARCTEVLGDADIVDAAARSGSRRVDRDDDGRSGAPR